MPHAYKVPKSSHLQHYFKKKKNHLKGRANNKAIVSEYVLQQSDLCLCHQISAYTQVQTANWDLPFKEEGKKKGGGEREKEKRILADRRKEHYSKSCPSPPTPPAAFSGLWYEKTMAFLRLCADKAALKKLIAMINDNGLEESWDTAATYIIRSHQSLLLPAPLPTTSKAL